MASRKSVTTKPVTGESVTVKGNSVSAKPSMNPPLQSSSVESGIVSASRSELIVADVNAGFNAMQAFETAVHGGRVGPNGRWTILVEKYCFTYKDWQEIKTIFHSALRAKIVSQIKEENAKPDEIDDKDWHDLIQGMADARMKSPSVNTLVSQFGVIGRFFSEKGPGKDRLLEILKGTGQAKLTYSGTIKQLVDAVPTGRGRKAGSTNVNPVRAESNAPNSGASSGTIAQVENNPEAIKTQTRLSTSNSAVTFINSLFNDPQYLVPSIRALGNKLKESDVKELQELGLLMIDTITPERDEEDEEDEEPARKTA